MQIDKDSVPRYTMIFTVMIAAGTALVSTTFFFYQQQRQMQLELENSRGSTVQILDLAKQVHNLQLTLADVKGTGEFSSPEVKLLRAENASLKDQLALYKQNNELLTARVALCPKTK